MLCQYVLMRRGTCYSTPDVLKEGCCHFTNCIVTANVNLHFPVTHEGGRKTSILRPKIVVGGRVRRWNTLGQQPVGTYPSGETRWRFWRCESTEEVIWLLVFFSDCPSNVRQSALFPHRPVRTGRWDDIVLTFRFLFNFFLFWTGIFGLTYS